MQGQRSHLAQARNCHKRWQAGLGTTGTHGTFPKNLFESRTMDNNQTAELGERPATTEAI